jgi:hypothetical protein
MSEYNQILTKKRENLKTADTLEGIVEQLTVTSYVPQFVLDKVILELETLIKQLRI